MEMEKKRKGKRFWEYKIEIQLDVNEGREGKSNMREMSFIIIIIFLFFCVEAEWKGAHA